MVFSLFKRPVAAPSCDSPADETSRHDDTRSMMVAVLDHLAHGRYDSARTVAGHAGLDLAFPAIDRLKSTMQTMLADNVQLSMHINESSNIGAKLNRISLDINHRSQGMAAALEELSTSSSSILKSTQDVFADAQEMKGHVASSIQTSHDLETAMTQIDRVVDQTQGRVDALVTSTEEIKRILGIITTISNQTKLLSLNATIEAARAGEAGKGFAVVAGEVKKLAEETAHSADEISQKVLALSNVTQEITSLMGDVAAAVQTGTTRLQDSSSCIQAIDAKSENVLTQMQDVFTIIHDQHSAVAEISQSVAHIADMTRESVTLIDDTLGAIDATESLLSQTLSQFAVCELDHVTVQLAKSDHVIWKKRLSSMAAGRITLDPSGLADHTKCRLGKWYYSEASQPYRHLPAFGAIEQAHIDVHAHGIEAARKFNAHDLDGALAEIDIVEDRSHIVLDQLEKLHNTAP